MQPLDQLVDGSVCLDQSGRIIQGATKFVPLPLLQQNWGEAVVWVAVLAAQETV